MDRYDVMKIFISVAELKSFSRTAEQLNIPNATVSNAVKELETRVGAQLLIRTTRIVELTPQGSAFLERCRNLLIEVEETETMFRSSPGTVKGKLRIGMTVNLSRDFFIPLLPQFYEEFPGIEIELNSSDRNVDVMREGFDCVIRGGNNIDPSLIFKEVGAMDFINVASSTYLEKYGIPKNLEELKNHQLIEYSQVLGAKTTGFEYFFNGRLQTLEMKYKLTVDSIDAYQAACLAGIGIIQCPSGRIKEELRSGKLVEILPDFRPAPITLNLAYPRQRVTTKSLNAFNQWIEGRLKDFIYS